MAKAYAPPEEIPTPELGGSNFDFLRYEKDCDEFETKLYAWCKANTKSTSDLVGEVYTYPVADGRARYMVFNTKPLELIHIDTGDAYGLPDAHIRGLRVADIKDNVKGQKAIRALFSKKDEDEK